MKKKVFIVIGVLFIIFFVWRIVTIVISRSTSGEMRFGGRPPVAVQVAKVSYEQIQDISKFTGTIYPLYRYIIAPKVTGRVIEIRKRIGDTVKRGEIVARLDDAEYQQAVLEAEANLKIAQASLAETQGQAELARQELERVQSLQDKGISSASELDAAITNNTAQQARLKLAQATVEQRKAALNSARIRLSYTELVAPEPGFVGERFVDEGALLAPNSPVITVVGIDRIMVRTTVIERDYSRIHIGQETTVTVDAYPSEKFIGKVARIAPVVEESSRVAQMEIEVDNPTHVLKPGMFARVSVVLEQHENAQVVPSAALVTTHGAQESHGVYVIASNSDPVARYIPVKLGITTPEKIEIVSPKIDGMVVTLGQHLLSDGSPVILPEQNPGGGLGRESGGQNREARGNNPGASGGESEQ